MRRLAIFVATVLASCGGESAAHSAPESDSAAHCALVGTTLDAATGALLADVELSGPDGARTRSNAEGRFAFENLSTGWSGEVSARTADGRAQSLHVRPLQPGSLEVVLHLR